MLHHLKDYCQLYSLHFRSYIRLDLNMIEYLMLNRVQKKQRSWISSTKIKMLKSLVKKIDDKIVPHIHNNLNHDQFLARLNNS
jgi:hypothetical protein